MFVDVHSHVVPSGDDGAATVADGLALCRAAAERGTRVLCATPHVWPHLPLGPAREEAIRERHAAMAAACREFGLELELGFELTPARALLDDDDLGRYRLGRWNAVLVELPFEGELDLVEQLAERVDAAGLVPVLAHPERADAVGQDLDLAVGFRGRGWLLQVNASSLLGRHGIVARETAWALIDRGVVDLVASDGHRPARPPFLDGAYEAVRRELGDAADELFDGRRLAALDEIPLPAAAKG